MLLPERLAGAIYGHLVGDALGVPYEFTPPERVDDVEWRGHGTYDQPAGTWSDDGALMLALLDSLLSVGFDPDDQGKRAVAWRDEGRYAPGGRVFDIGTTTSASLGRIKSGTPAENAGGIDTLGNGSLMRIVPLPLVMRASEDEQLVGLAARASRVTHASAEAQIACALYSLIVQRLLAGETDRDAVLTGARTKLRAVLASRGLDGSPVASEPAAALQALDAFESWPGRAGRGHVVDSFWSSWDAFASSSEYRETVIKAVRYGNDTDTTAAIAGGLAGAYWGITCIPSEWQRGLRDRHIPQELVDRLIETDTSEWDGTPWRTSRLSPLRVDAVDISRIDAEGNGGRVGITFLPGKRYLGTYTGPHWRDLDTDAGRLHELGVDLLLLLVEDSELEQCRITDITGILPAHGVELLRFPIQDPRTPADSVAFRATIAGLLQRVRQGAFLAIACRGGLDRSGLAAACLLREAGLDADDAIDRVQAARKRALTIDEQQSYVRAWAPME
jgi:ADP-ribosyl-[dinitrogen reductase] hydrolase